MIHTYLFLTTFMFFPSFLFIILFLRRKKLWDKDFKERLGLFNFKAKSPKGKRIWIHAASVGEVKIAHKIVSHLVKDLKEWEFFVSTNTRYGRAEALRLLGEIASVFYAPLDFIIFVRNSINRIKPDIMVFVETELWPNWLYCAKKSKAKVVLLNARISSRSFNRYLAVRAFMKQVLNLFDHISAISNVDAKRMIQLGCKKDLISVNGNAKLDEFHIGYECSKYDHLKEELRFRNGASIIIAGSVRRDEFDAVLDSYEIVINKHPHVDLIIAPRHLENISVLKAKLNKRGISYRTRSGVERVEQGKGSVLILDTMGELSKLYAIGDIIFLGASLVPLGGQNPVEPALWAKPILSGPSYEDFEEIFVHFLKKGGAIIVRSARELGESFNMLLEEPEKARLMGNNAKEVVLSLKGASQRHASVILRLSPNI